MLKSTNITIAATLAAKSNRQNISIGKSPAYQNRKTLAEHVKLNMDYLKRNAYYQRIIICLNHQNVHLERAKEMQEHIKTMLNIINSNNQNIDKLTGLLLFYNSHSIYMLEGAEDFIGRFMKLLVKTNLELNFFQQSKIILCHNNINQRFFKEILYKFGEPSELLLLVEEAQQFNNKNLQSVQLHINNFIKKIIDLCRKIKDDNLDRNVPDRIDNHYLGFEYHKILPEIQLIDYLLANPMVFDSIEFSKLYESIPELNHYNENVWPIQYDFTIQHIFDYSEYKIK